VTQTVLKLVEVSASTLVLGWFLLKLLDLGKGAGGDKSSSAVLFRFVFVGSFAILPALIVYAFFELLPFAGAQGNGKFLWVWLVNAPLEELTKFLCFYLLSRRLNSIREPLDGLLQGAATGLGFALVENFQYALGGGLGLFWLRSLVSLPGHVIYGAVWGGYYGFEYYQGRGKIHRPYLVVLALVPAIFAHGVFNTALDAGWGLAAALLVDVLALVLVIVLYKSLRRASPYRIDWNDLGREQIQKELEHAVALNSSSATLVRKWGAALLAKGKLFQAQEVFLQAAQVRPLDPWNDFWAAAVAWKSGKPETWRSLLTSFQRQADRSSLLEARRICRLLPLDFPKL
jgi:RsiW-degrading membrane proteinase PrsW (M82 family)